MQDSNQNFFLLNREGRWPGFQRNGLELGRQTVILRLGTVPLFSGSLPDSLKTAPTPDGPAGLAIDRYGSVYFSDPVNNRVARIDACDGSSGQVPCMGGGGTQLARFSAPRGLLVPHHRRSLFVADSGNHRIQIFDLATFQLVEVWGRPAPGATPSRVCAGRVQHAVDAVRRSCRQRLCRRLRQSPRPEVQSCRRRSASLLGQHARLRAAPAACGHCCTRTQREGLDLLLPTPPWPPVFAFRPDGLPVLDSKDMRSPLMAPTSSSPWGSRRSETRFMSATMPGGVSPAFTSARESNSSVTPSVIGPGRCASARRQRRPPGASRRLEPCPVRLQARYGFRAGVFSGSYRRAGR